MKRWMQQAVNCSDIRVIDEFKRLVAKYNQTSLSVCSLRYCSGYIFLELVFSIGCGLSSRGVRAPNLRVSLKRWRLLPLEPLVQDAGLGSYRGDIYSSREISRLCFVRR